MSQLEITFENSAYKVLIVDDLDDNRTLLRLDLEDELPGIHIKEAKSGFEALDLINKEDFTLVLCDLMMPEMDGFEVYKRVKEFKKQSYLPFIFISANQDPTMTIKGLELGAFDFLKKPYDVIELVLKSKNLCKIKLLHDKQVELLTKIEGTNRRLEQINDQKDNVLRIVSHDMRNPLGNIIGLAEILQEEPNQSDEDIKNISSIIIKSGENLLGIVNTLLDAAKLDSGKIELNLTQTELVSLIQFEVDQFSYAAKQKHIKLNFYSEESEIHCFMDEPKIRQSIANLISNSLKFSNSNSEIWIYISRNNSTIDISIKDSGIGIPKEQIPFVFEKFSPAQRIGTKNERGTGLGLSIVKAFIQLHRGSIEIQSDLNSGTTFKITLPELLQFDS